MGQASNIKNILFDLGGVILDINVQATLKRFYELGFPAELIVATTLTNIRRPSGNPEISLWPVLF